MTTIKQPICINCKHLDMMKHLSDDNIEDGKYFCPAYPDGIPDEILHGDDDHVKVRPDQVGDYKFTFKFI